MNALKITLRKKKSLELLDYTPHISFEAFSGVYIFHAFLIAFFFYFFFQLHYEMNGNIYDIRKAIIYHRKKWMQLKQRS